MRYRLRYILISLIFLIVAGTIKGENIVDKVCKDAVRTYRVDGASLLTYTWILTDSVGNSLMVSSGSPFSDKDIYGNPLIGSELQIIWSYDPGIYTLAVQKQNQYSCTIDTAGIIEILPNPEVFAGDDLIVCKGGTGILDKATASNYSKISWTTKGDGKFDNSSILNPVYIPGPNDIIAGTVILTIIAEGQGDEGSCTPVSDDLALSIINIDATVSVSRVTCFGANDGTISVTDKVPGSYQYSIGTGWQTNSYFMGLQPGNYIVKVIDPLKPGCEVAVDTVDVLGPLPLTAKIDVVQPSCFDGNGSITLSGSGGWGSYQFSLNNAGWQSSGYFPNLPASSYSAKIRDAAFPDCVVDLGNIEIDQPSELLATITATPASCYGGASGKISLTKLSGGSGNFEFTKDGVNWQSSPNFINLLAGTYPLTMRDADNIVCEKFLGNIEVTEPLQMIASATATDATCFGAKDGKILISLPMNGTPPYMYSLHGTSWQVSGLFENLGAGVYTSVQVRDANMCIFPVGIVKVGEPPKMKFDAIKTNETVAGANDGTITITSPTGGSGNYEYKFDGFDWQLTNTISNLAPSTYLVMMRDALNPTCDIDTLLTIYPAGSVTSKYTPENVSCYGSTDGKITFFDYTGATNYLFSIDNGTTWQVNPLYTGLATGSYLLMIRDADHPVNTAFVGKVEIYEPSKLDATVTITPESSAGANDGKIAISNPKGGSGNYQYSLDGTTWVTSNTFTGLASGSYTVFIGDKNVPTCFVTVPKIIQPAGQLAADVEHNDILCNGDKNGSIKITNPTGVTAYQYSINGGVNWNNSDTFNGLSAGIYNVMLRDRFDTSNSVLLEVVTIAEPKPLRGRFSIDSEPLCAGASGVVSIFSTGGTGTKTYRNATTGTLIVNPTFAVAAGEKISIVVIDENNCQDVFTISMPNPQPLIVNSVVYPPKCFGDNGSIEITASGGTGDLFINGVKLTSSTVSYIIQAGKPYYYEITDSNGCLKPISGTMPFAPSQITATTSVINDVSCFGGNDGQATVTASGGSGVYTYKWSDPAKQTTQTAIGLRKGTYTVTITDSNNCSNSFQVTINELPAAEEPMATVVQPDCDVSTGSIVITKPVPSAGITYRLTGINPVVAPTANLTGVFPTLVPGVYEYTVTNALGCTSSPKTVTIESHPLTPANPIVNSIAECEADPIQTLNANKGVTSLPPGVVIVWYDAPTGGNVVAQPILNSAQTVTYYAEATNGDCISPGRTSVSLTIIPRPSSPISKGDLSACESSPMVTLDARNAIDPASIIDLRWFHAMTGGMPVANPLLNSVGSVTYYAENNGGTCSSSPRIPVKLTIYTNPVAPILSLTEIPKCSDSYGVVNVTSPVGPEYVYSADNGTYQASPVFNLYPGSHNVKVKNSITTCESPLSTIVVPDIPPQPHITNLSVEDCICYGDSGKLNFEFENVVDGTYVIVYVGGQFNNVEVFDGKASVSAVAGNYSVLAIEANGCTSPEDWNVVINQPNKLSISAKITEIDLKSGQKGEIDLTISGGTGLYTTVWAPNVTSGFTGATTEDIKDLNNGDYVVNVTDEKGCMQKQTLTIPLPNMPPIATPDEFDANCNSITGDLLYTDNGSGIDSDPDNDPFEIDIVPIKLPSYGTLTINPDGTFVFKAVRGYIGDDTFIYQIYDVKKNYSNPAVVTIHIAADSDGDGLVDNIDPDADGDGILNVNEVLSGQDWKTTDSDGDGNANYLDIDSDGDGILDNIEAQPSLGYLNPDGIDTDNDGVDDAYDTDNGGTTLIPINTDLTSSTGGDDLPDFMDTDSDDDLVPDYIEGHDVNADGRADVVMGGKDFDADGLDDVYDTLANDCSIDNAFAGNAAIQDFDMDGQRDWRDENDDDDEYLTRFEDLNMDGNFSNDDTDFDNHPEYLDYGRDCDLFVPDAFSPNNDNIHDYFMVYCINHFPNAQMFIFDQNGNKLFEKNNYGNLIVWGTPDRAWWDGRTTNRSVTTNGGKVLPGTYYYVLRLGNGEVKKSFVFVSY